MSSIIELTRWYGPVWRGYVPQLIPTCEELAATGAVETGECVPDYGDELPALPAERDQRTWYVESPCRSIVLLLVPDLRGFFLEDAYGDRWRPHCLQEMSLLLQALAHTGVYAMARVGA